MARNFSEWLSGFRDSIADYGYYTDFEKVHRNVKDVTVELNILNSLIGSKTIEEDFLDLLKRYPEVLRCIPLLLAVRADEIYCQDSDGAGRKCADCGRPEAPARCRSGSAGVSGPAPCRSCRSHFPPGRRPPAAGS